MRSLVHIGRNRTQLRGARLRLLELAEYRLCTINPLTTETDIEQQLVRLANVD
ncbi:MAG: hypothetical protein ACLPTJ_22065 [Solirubrobacteraceae bacterium]